MTVFQERLRPHQLLRCGSRYARWKSRAPTLTTCSGTVTTGHSWSTASTTTAWSFFGPMSPTRFAPTWPRGSIPPDEFGEALLVADGNFARGHRLSRRGVPHVVDGYLRAAGVKRPQVSNHALRHTSATLAYRYTHDLRAVRDLPGSQDDRPLCARR